MGRLEKNIKAISDDLVAGLEALERLPLVDGKILIGAALVTENAAPPRIVVEPIKWAPGAIDRASQGVGPDYPGADLMGAILGAQLGTRYVFFRFHIWAVANSAPGAEQDSLADLEACDVLLDDFQRSCLRVLSGIVVFQGGQYINSQTPKSPVLIPYGWYVDGILGIPLPIQDYLLEPASDDPDKPIGAAIDTQIQPSDGGEPEAGPTINVPNE